MSETESRPQPEWARPGAYPVAPGVHRIPLPMPSDGLVAVNVYAIEDGDRLLLVDGGWAVPEARAQLDRSLADLDADARAISRILVTHVHRDHYTLALQLRREVGARVGLGAGERPTILALNEPRERRFIGQRGTLHAAGAEQLAATLAVGEPHTPDPKDWEHPDEWLEPGLIELEDRTLDILHTPGHTQGHLVFHDSRADLLFAGDHVLPHITPSIGFEVVPPTSPLEDFLASLRLLRARRDAALLPAHGTHGPSVHARVSELLDHHRARLDEMESVVAAAGEATGFQVATGVGWTRRRRAFDDLDPFNQMLAVSETMSHLTVLVDEGRLVRSPEDVPRYSVPRTTG